MPDEELTQKLTALEHKIDATYAPAEKTRKYFLWTIIISLAAFLLPLIGILFALPSFLGSYRSLGNF